MYDGVKRDVMGRQEQDMFGNDINNSFGKSDTGLLLLELIRKI